MAETAHKTAVALYDAIANDVQLTVPVFQTADKSMHFQDLAKGEYYVDAVAWAVNHQPQITNGKTGTAFAPNDTCTREQAVTFLWRAAGCPEPTVSDCPFTDVSADSYSYKAILWAVENSITKGMTETTFVPDGACTRAQIVTFLFRAKQGAAAADAQNPFDDVAADTWYTDAVLWAVANHVTNGMTDTAFGPDITCTRAHIVTFLFRADDA